MRDFRSMFPEMEPSVIEAVLRANGGGVDATIDQLLAMATDNDNERLRTELEATENAEAPPHYSPPGRTPPPSYQQATTPLPQGPTEPTPPRLAGEEDQSKSSTKAPSWKPPLLGPLPPGFLRLQQPSPPSPTEGSPQGSLELSSVVLQQRMEENVRRQRRLAQGGSGSGDLARFLEDERMAILLQNQEFVRQLRRNRDFMTTLDRDIQDQALDQGAGLVPDQDAEEGALPPWTRPPGDAEDTDAAFRERLKNMGKASRRKFAQLARLFSRTKKCHFRQMLGEGPNPSRDNLLLNEDPCSELSEEDSYHRRLHDQDSQASDTQSGADSPDPHRSPAAHLPTSGQQSRAHQPELA